MKDTLSTGTNNRGMQSRNIAFRQKLGDRHQVVLNHDLLPAITHGASRMARGYFDKFRAQIAMN